MNSIENKIKLWNSCSQMGLFNNIEQAFEPQIKQLFEENISKFNTNNNTDNTNDKRTTPKKKRKNNN